MRLSPALRRDHRVANPEGLNRIYEVSCLPLRPLQRKVLLLPITPQRRGRSGSPCLMIPETVRAILAAIGLYALRRNVCCGGLWRWSARTCLESCWSAAQWQPGLPSRGCGAVGHSHILIALFGHGMCLIGSSRGPFHRRLRTVGDVRTGVAHPLRPRWSGR